LFAGFALCPPGRAAGEAPADNPQGLDDRTRAVVAAAGVVGVGDLAGAVGLLNVAQGTSTWAGVAEKPADKAPKVVLEGIKDRTPVRAEEAKEYNDLLVLAHKTPAAAFANSSRKDLTFAHLFEQPELYRGEIVHVEGRMNRLRVFEAPAGAREAGVEQMYEGWIFDKDLYGGQNPMCLVFTDPPAGMRVGEKVNYLVKFDGYFFKRYRYPAGDGMRDSPLLIGHGPVLAGPAASGEEQGSTLGTDLVLLFLSLLVGIMVLAVGLTWWYRRGDRHVRSRLAGAHEIGFQEPTPETETAAREERTEDEKTDLGDYDQGFGS
jgi:hypothetical protein